MKQEFESRISEQRVREMIESMRAMNADAKLISREFELLLTAIDDGEVYAKTKWVKLFEQVTNAACNLDDYFQFGRVVALKRRKIILRKNSPMMLEKNSG